MVFFEYPLFAGSPSLPRSVPGTWINNEQTKKLLAVTQSLDWERDNNKYEVKYVSHM